LPFGGDIFVYVTTLILDHGKILWVWDCVTSGHRSVSWNWRRWKWVASPDYKKILRGPLTRRHI